MELRRRVDRKVRMVISCVTIAGGGMISRLLSLLLLFPRDCLSLPLLRMASSNTGDWGGMSSSDG